MRSVLLLLLLVVTVGCGGSAVAPIVPEPRRPPRGEPLEMAEPPPPPPDDRTLIVAEPAPDLLIDDSRRETFEHGRFGRICVRDEARIDVDGSIDIELASDETTVIAGRGIGPVGTTRATVRIRAAGAPKIFVLFDNERAPVDAIIEAPRSQVEVGITGKTGLTLGGATAQMTTHGGWGLPPSFPTCE